jgi:hypothetical protein
LIAWKDLPNWLGVEREGKAPLMDPGQRKEALEEMKQSWSHNAAKDTTLEHTQLKQQKEISYERERY